MTLARLILLICCVCVTQLSAAQAMYKWVDKNGKVTYSDRPAPTDQDIQDLTSQINTMGAGEAQVSNLPFDLLQTMNRAPVTFYSAKGCPPCDQGRQLLKSRGIPYTEKLVESERDLKVLQEKFNVQTLPVLTVGVQSRFGFSSVEWGTALDDAGYPKESKLPKGYATGKVETLSPPVASSPAQNPNATSNGQNTDQQAINPTQKIRELLVPNVNTQKTEPKIKF